ncbi:MAG: type II 3-dehydroquinate dehydratase [Clostridia bacterium]|nr:type II 3-dehydroquinate dehydratase [Clostridia bacterium]
MKILVINGPNLNMLGKREPEIYGVKTLDDLDRFCYSVGKKAGAKVDSVQSNHEGEIIDEIQNALARYDGIVINAGGYTHTSVSILDALKAVAIPTVEVHLSDVKEREEFRKFSYISLYAEKVIIGKGFEGYAEAIEYLVDKYKK